MKINFQTAEENGGYLISPVFKKDGRTWLHKSSAPSKYGITNLVSGRFKKDSRTWLHKKSKKRKLFTTLSDSKLYELMDFPTRVCLKRCYTGPKNDEKYSKKQKLSDFTQFNSNESDLAR